MINRLNSFIFLTAAIFIICCIPVWADEYTYDAVNPSGWSWSYSHGINDSGDIVGYGGIDSTTKSFYFSNGTYTKLNPPGWTSSYALTINSSGDIVGYGTVNGIYKGFLYSNSSYTELLPPGWLWAWSIRINDNAEVVGGGSTGSSSRGFLYSNGVYTELLPPGWSVSTAYGINDSGIVAGWGTDGSGIDKGYIYFNGTYTELLPPGWSSATAYYINEIGEVVGEGVDGIGMEKGYLYSNGKYIELYPQGWSDVVPEYINDSGVVVGYGTENSVVKGFVYLDGSYTILISPDRPHTTLIGINNNNEIVGQAYNPSTGFIFSGCQYYPAKILKTIPEYYLTLQDAYDNAVDGDMIQSRASTFTEELLLDINKNVRFIGGYDCEYTKIYSVSELNGDIIISNGTVILENIILK